MTTTIALFQYDNIDITSRTQPEIRGLPDSATSELVDHKLLRSICASVVFASTLRGVGVATWSPETHCPGRRHLQCCAYDAAAPGMVPESRGNHPVVTCG